MSQKNDDTSMLNDQASRDAISKMEWSPGSPGSHLTLASEHESLSNPTHQNETLFGDLDTSIVEKVTIPLSGTGMTQTRGPGPLGQFQKHFTKPLVPFLTMVYLRAESILQTARSVHVFHMQSLYIARQALHLVILLNDLVDEEEGPDDTQQAERIDLEDDLIELLEAMEEWGASLAEGGYVDYEQGVLKIQHHYMQIFKERFYFHETRDATNDPIYQKLLAYDERTIQKRQRCRGATNIVQVDHWIGQEECDFEDQEESEGLPGIFESGTVVIPTISSMYASDPLPDSGGMLANVEQQARQQVTTQDHAIIKLPTPCKETGNLGIHASKLPAHASIYPSGSSRASGLYATEPDWPTIKPLVQTARPPNKQRQRAREPEDESDFPYDYHGDEVIGQQPLQGGAASYEANSRLATPIQTEVVGAPLMTTTLSDFAAASPKPSLLRANIDSYPEDISHITALSGFGSTMADSQSVEGAAYLNPNQTRDDQTHQIMRENNWRDAGPQTSDGQHSFDMGQTFSESPAFRNPYFMWGDATSLPPNVDEDLVMNNGPADIWDTVVSGLVSHGISDSADRTPDSDAQQGRGTRPPALGAGDGTFYSGESNINLPSPHPTPSDQFTKMMGTSAPWNPKLTIPSHPTDETLAAEYRAFLDSTAAPATPYSGHLNTSATFGYGHEENDETRRDESQNSSSAHTSPYGTANSAHYAPPDPYPPFNQPDIGYSLSQSGDLIANVDQILQGSQRRSTVNFQQPQHMLTMSFSSFESPNSSGIPLASSQQQQYQYFPKHARPYYSGGVVSAGYNNGNQQQKQPIKSPMQTAKPPSKKRQRVQEPDGESESSSDYYGEEATVQQPRQGSSSTGGQTARLPGACAPCKRLKMKCVFAEGQNDCCQRCRNSGRVSQCVVGPRRPRHPSNTKELLLQKLREQDTVIKSKDAVIKFLLEQVQNPRLHMSLRDSISIASGGGIPADLQNAPHEQKPVDKPILEWIAKAQASIQSTPGFRRVDARLLDEDSSESSSEFEMGLGGRDVMSPTKSKSSFSGSNGRLAAPDAAAGSHSIKSSPKLHSLPLKTTPIGLLAELSLADNKEKEKKAQSKRSKSGPKPHSASGAKESAGSYTGAGDSSAGVECNEDDVAIGVAGRGYFQPAPISNTGLKPNILERTNIMTSGLISPAEADKLFKIYFDRLNVFISVLDPVLHTPATTFGRCPFLFTVVCAITSRYYTERPELYSIAMHFAKRAAASSLIEAAKSVELCQAYILMSVYSVPSRRWENAREWLYLGLAIRMAKDLNLHVKSTTKILNEHHERELLNRTRTWLNLYNLDLSTSAQLGRPASIRPDPIIRSCKEQGKRQAWWKSSPVNDPFDLHLCAYTDLMSSVTAEFQEAAYWNPETETTGLRTDLDLFKIALQYDDKLQGWYAKTAVSFATHSDSSSPQCAYRVQLLPFYVNYLRLVMLSLGFQQAVQKGATNVDPELVNRCLNAACGVVKTVVEDLAPTEYFRFAPDGHFVFSSFASAFLIKILRPEHATLLDVEQRIQIIDLVERLVGTLKSPRIAVDVHHTPMLYSRFLAGLLAKYKQSDNTETVDDGVPSAPTRAYAIGLPTLPPMEKREISQTPDLSGGRTFNTVADLSKDKTSPSIEISPPAPNSASGIPPPQPDMIYDPAQYTMLQDGGMLAPMLAMESPGFWDSMMLPGIPWPAEDMQWAMNLDDGSDSQFSHDAGHYQQEDGY